MFDPVSYTVTEGGQSPMVCVTIMGLLSGGTEADVVVTLMSMDGLKTGITISVGCSLVIVNANQNIILRRVCS